MQTNPWLSLKCLALTIENQNFYAYFLSTELFLSVV